MCHIPATLAMASYNRDWLLLIIAAALHPELHITQLLGNGFDLCSKTSGSKVISNSLTA
jgi:hypothetical protein